jgi:hypothetical protein
MECEAGKQLHLTAPSDKLFTSVPAIVREVFKLAPAKAKALGLLGGGANTLPAGYLAAEFLESTGTQYIDTGYVPKKTSGVFARVGISGGYFDPFILGCRNNASTNTRWVPPRPRNFEGGLYTNGFGWGSWLLTLNSSQRDTLSPALSWLNYKNEHKAKLQGKDQSAPVSVNLDDLPFTPLYSAFMFGFNIAGSPALTNNNISFYFVEFTEDEKIKMSFIPAIDAQGVPCMYDKVSNQPFDNDGTGAFIVGMTLAQARKLGKLPEGGGTLTVSLPSNWQEDEGVVNALATAEAKGWVFTYQTYEAEAGAASTFALRRIWVRKTQSEHGGYVSADGSRWLVEWCAGMIGADPQEHGYEPYRSVDAAVAYWELQPYGNNEEEFLNEL